MSQTFVQNALSTLFIVIPVFIALRSFMLYRNIHSTRLLILAISLSMIALTAAAGFAGDNITSISLNVDWFNYIGQMMCFLFFWLSLLRSDETYLRTILRWQLLTLVPLLLLMLLSPILPAEFPDPAVTKTLLSGSRGLICIFIFYYYLAAFMKKETVFSFFMGLAFLLIGFGIFIILPKYFLTGGQLDTDFLDRMGDITRITGLFTLLVAVMVG